MTAAVPPAARTLALITPTYRPDLELCRDLCATVSRYAPAGTRHELVVPAADLAAFAELAGPTRFVTSVDTLLPRGFVPVPRVNAWVNLRRPFPPVRGWIAQQLVKLGAAAASDADVVLLVDSDMAFVRPFSAADFSGAGDAVTFYRAPDAVHAGLPRHVQWHREARRLLGLPPSDRMPLTDYISWPMVWEPEVVRGLLARVEQVTGRPWPTALGATVHLSEGILYGVYVDEVLAGSPAPTSQMRSVGHSAETALTPAELDRLLASVTPADVAVMVSAKSGTDLAARRSALAAHLT